MGYLYLLSGFQPKLSARLFGESERILLQPKSEPDRVCQMCAKSAKLPECWPCSAGSARLACCCFRGRLANTASLSQHQPKSQKTDS